MSPRFATALVFALAFAPASAGAFCRSTTCTGNCKRDADNCKTEGAPLFWTSQCVGFSLNINASQFVSFADFQRVTKVSAAAWSGLKCPKGEATFAYAQLPAVDCHKAEYNPGGANANIILFQDNRWTYTSADNTLAKTTVTYDSATGEILDADIEINHAYNEITVTDVPANVRFDLQSILTHEFGHFLGLDHTQDPQATMNAAYDQGSIDLRTLEEDDIAGACTIYPPGRKSVCAPEPRGGLANFCAGEEPKEGGCSITVKETPRWGLGALVALAALAFGRWRLRRT